MDISHKQTNKQTNKQNSHSPNGFGLVSLTFLEALHLSPAGATFFQVVLAALLLGFSAFTTALRGIFLIASKVGFLVTGVWGFGGYP